MVYIFLAEGFEEAEALVPADILRRAGLHVSLVGVSGEYVTGGHGVCVRADITADKLPEQPEFEAVVLPGGSPGFMNLKKSETVRRWTQHGVESGALVAAICGAPSVLYEWGLLNGPATVYPSMKDTVGEFYSSQPVVWSKPVLTANAAGSAFDFALAIIQKLRGAEAAEKTADSVHYSSRTKGAN